MATVPCLLRLNSLGSIGTATSAAVKYRTDAVAVNYDCSDGELNTRNMVSTYLADTSETAIEMLSPENAPFFFSSHPMKNFFYRVDVEVPDSSAPLLIRSSSPTTGNYWTVADFLTAAMEGTAVSYPHLAQTWSYSPYPATPAIKAETYSFAYAPTVLHHTTLPHTFTQSPTSVTYDVTWLTYDCYLDGTLYQEGTKAAKLTINGTDYAMSVSTSVVATDTQTMYEFDGTTDFWTFAGVTTEYSEWNDISTQWDVIQCVGTVTVLPQTAGEVLFKFVNSAYGVEYAPANTHMVPVADVDLVFNDPDLLVDGGDSYTHDSPIATYDFTVYNGAEVIYDGSPQAGSTVTIPNIESLLDDDATLTATVRVVTDYGCFDLSDVDDPGASVEIEVPHRTDAADLPSKAHYVFYRAGADLKLAFYPEGQSSRSVVATFAGCKSPSFWVKSDSSFRAAMDNGTSYILKSSYDRGATWSSSLATIWNSTNYYKAASCGLKTGGMASVAVKRGTSPAEVYVKVSNDETNWVSDASATLVDTTTSTATQFSIRQKNESGQNTLVVTNGVDEFWKSVDMGATWVSV